MFFVGLGRVARARKMTPKSIENVGKIYRKRDPQGTFLEALGCPGDAFGGSRGGLGTGTRNETRGTEFLDPPRVAFWTPLGALGLHFAPFWRPRGVLEATFSSLFSDIDFKAIC